MKSGIIIATAILALVASPMTLAKDKNSQLPPGLQKKAAKGQQLPPGWQKKLQKGAVLDKSIVDAGVVVKAPTPSGAVTIRIEDRLLQLDVNTRKILDILR